jgi:hypothetical protein
MAKTEELAMSSSLGRIAGRILGPDVAPADPRLTVVAADVAGSRLLTLEHGWQAGFSPEDADDLLRDGETWAAGPEDLRTLASSCAAYGLAVVRALGQLPRARLLTEAGLRFAHKARNGTCLRLRLRRITRTGRPWRLPPRRSRRRRASNLSD